MKAVELIAQGRAREALQALQTEVRQSPADAKLRIFLFQLLAVLGDWDRAMQQLDVAGQMDPGALLMAQVCRQAILCETMRTSVFQGERSPLLMGEPEPWMGLMVQALQMSAQGKHAEAEQLRERAREEAPVSAGQIELTPPGARPDDEKPVPGIMKRFAWIADADMRLGPILEAYVEGKYYWIPWMRIREVKLDPPSDLRDAIWLPANFVWSSGGASVGLIPARYPDSHRQDDQLALGRRTDFTEPAPGVSHCLGQKLLATDEGEYGLLETRVIRLDVTI